MGTIKRDYLGSFPSQMGYPFEIGGSYSKGILEQRIYYVNPRWNLYFVT